MTAINPYGRTTRRDGVVLNYRTLEMFEVAELHYLTFRPVLSQGSYNAGVTQSAGTHDGGGALDVRARDLTGSQREIVVTALRKMGFAAWLRTPAQGNWPYHIHAIAIGDKQMSPEAAAQVVDYKNGRNGLAGHGPDDGPKVSWTEYRQDVDLSYYGPEKWDADDWRLFRSYVHGNAAGSVDRGVPYQDLAKAPVAASSPQELVEYIRKTTKGTEDDVAAVDGKVVALDGDVAALDVKVQKMLDHFGLV